ncbi:MAG: trypsin-like peptidase domain-containing protein [Rhodospirillales bacterium]
MTAATATSDPRPQLTPLWVGVYLLLLLAIAALAVWLFLRQPPVEYRDIPAAMSAEDRARLEAEQQNLQDKEQRIARLNEEIARDICPPGTVKDASAAPSGGPGAVRQRGNGAASGPAVTPPAGAADAPSQTTPETTPPAAAPSQNGEVKPLTTAGLRDSLRVATAFIFTEVAGDKDALSTGTGFFIAPNLLMTNRHVVEKAVNKTVYVTSKSMGGAAQGEVLAMSRKDDKGIADFALVRVDGVNITAPLRLTASYDALQPVVAAGYPGFVTLTDISMRQMFEKGDFSAAPSLVMNQGSIQALQPISASDEWIVHSTDISQGNSGGPLVDRCGRVIGINTFIRIDSENAGRVSYALSAKGIAGFIQSYGVTPSLDRAVCAD